MGTASGTSAVERVHPPDWAMRFVNPIMRTLLRRGAPKGLAEQLILLHVTGRRSGRCYDIPVGRRRVDGRLLVLSSSGWRVNLRDTSEIEATIGGERRPALATLVEDPDEVARLYARLIDEIGYEKAGRELGIRINVDRAPTPDELRCMIERVGLSAIWIDFRQ